MSHLNKKHVDPKLREQRTSYAPSTEVGHTEY